MNIPHELEALFSPPSDGIRYIKRTTIGGSGNGSALNPHTVSTAQDFDSLIERLNDDIRVNEVVLLPGHYLTRGAWAYRDYRWFTRPIRLRGSGSDNTTVALDADAVFQTGGNTRQDTILAPFGCNPGGTNNIHISDITFDGNAHAFQDRMVSGLFIVGNHCSVRNVVVKGLRGRADKQIEAFGIITNNRRAHQAFTQPHGGTTIENCTVINDVIDSDYLSGIFVGYLPYVNNFLHSTIRNCQVYSLPFHPVCHYGYSFNVHTIVSGCSAHQVKHAIYNDTGEMHDNIVSDCIFTNVQYTGASFLAIGNDSTGNPTPNRRRIKIRNCLFQYEPLDGQEWIGLALIDHNACGAEFQDISVSDCTFSGPPSAARPFTLVSAKAVNMRNIRFALNIVPSSAVQHLPPPTPNANRLMAYTGNRREDGATWSTLPNLK